KATGILPWAGGTSLVAGTAEGFGGCWANSVQGQGAGPSFQVLPMHSGSDATVATRSVTSPPLRSPGPWTAAIATWYPCQLSDSPWRAVTSCVTPPCANRILAVPWGVPPVESSVVARTVIFSWSNSWVPPGAMSQHVVLVAATADGRGGCWLNASPGKEMKTMKTMDSLCSLLYIDAVFLRSFS